MRENMRRGYYVQALELMTQRERLNNETNGQRRQQALSRALSRFDATGDPNALVPFYNRFVSGTDEITGITRQQQTSDGAPMFVVHGIDHETEQSFANPVSGHKLKQLVYAAADPALQQSLFVKQAESLIKREEEQTKQQAMGEKERQLFDHKTPVEHRNKLAEIHARGEQTRLSQNNQHNNTQSRAAAPAEIRTAEWLVANGVASDHDSAWKMVRSLKTQTREQFIQNTARELFKEGQNSLTGDALTYEDAASQAAQLYDAIHQAGGVPDTDYDDQENAYSTKDARLVQNWMQQSQSDEPSEPQPPEYLNIEASPASGFVEPAMDDEQTRLKALLEQRNAQTLPPVR